MDSNDTGARKGPQRHWRERAAPRPLDTRAVNELALAYVARFATSAGRLAAYLKRKLRERGWNDGTGDDGTGEDGAGDDGAGSIAAVVARMVDLGYIDDTGFAMARGEGMMRRGYGARRIAETLNRDGIDAPLIARAGGTQADRRAAALAFARRRRLGPFGRGSSDPANSAASGLDPATRARQVAAMMRAGHPLVAARAMVEAADCRAAQEWVDEADDS